MTSLSYREFALFAYSGALIWVTTFLSIGYFFGHYWISLFKNLKIDLDDIMTVVIIGGVLYLVYYLVKKRNTKT